MVAVPLEPIAVAVVSASPFAVAVADVKVPTLI